jgi:hypothetical protein
VQAILKNIFLIKKKTEYSVENDSSNEVFKSNITVIFFFYGMKTNNCFYVIKSINVLMVDTEYREHIKMNDKKKKDNKYSY